MIATHIWLGQVHSLQMLSDPDQYMGRVTNFQPKINLEVHPRCTHRKRSSFIVWPEISDSIHALVQFVSVNPDDKRRTHLPFSAVSPGIFSILHCSLIVWCNVSKRTLFTFSVFDSITAPGESSELCLLLLWWHWGGNCGIVFWMKLVALPCMPDFIAWKWTWKSSGQWFSRELRIELRSIPLAAWFRLRRMCSRHGLCSSKACLPSWMFFLSWPASKPRKSLLHLGLIVWFMINICVLEDTHLIKLFSWMHS